MDTSSQSPRGTSSSRSLGSSSPTQQQSSKFSVSLAAVRERLKTLADRQDAGTRTKRLFSGRSKVALGGSGVQSSTDTSKNLAVKPTVPQHAAPLSSNKQQSAESPKDNLLNEYIVDALQQELSRLLPSSVNDPQLAAGTSNQSRSSYSMSSPNAASQSLSPGQPPLLVSPAAHTQHKHVLNDDRSLKPVAVTQKFWSTKSKSEETATYLLWPEKQLAMIVRTKDAQELIFRARALPTIMWAPIFTKRPATNPMILQARRDRATAELARTAAKLRAESIKLPLNSTKMDHERRYVFARDFGKLLFNTNIFLRQNTRLDVRHEIMVRRENFQDAVDDTVEFLKHWETDAASRAAATATVARGGAGRCAQDNKQRGAPDADDDTFTPHRRSTRRPTSAGEVSSLPHHHPSLSATSDATASRRASRRGSLASDHKGHRTSHSAAQTTSVIDIKGILARPYDGPVVSDEYKTKLAALHAGLPPSAHGARGSSEPSSPSAARGSKKRFPRYDGLMNVSDTVGTTRRWGSLESLEGASVQWPSPIPKRSSVSSLAGSPNSKSRARALAPISDGPSRIAAAAHTIDEQPSVVIEQLSAYQAELQRGHEERNASVRFWFGRTERPVDRTTASMRSRLLSPQVLSFFDQSGLIDGRPGVPPPLSEKDGKVYSEERIAEARREASRAEVLAVRRRALRSGDGDSTAADVGTRDKSSAVTTRRPSVNATGGLAESNQDNEDDLEVSDEQGERRRVAISGYRGPNHATHNRDVPQPTAERLRELLSTVFVRGGNVSSFIRKLEREAQTGLKRPDVRRSNRDRLGGDSLPRMVL